jgi:hypothetical protein
MHDFAAFDALIEQRPKGALWHRRHEHPSRDEGQDRFALERKAPVSLSIALRERRDRGAGLVEIGIGDDRALIIEDRRENAFRMDVFQPVFGLEPEFVPKDQRISLDDNVGG